MKHHLLAKFINDLRDTSIKFKDTQQLRERLRITVSNYMDVTIDSIDNDMNELQDIEYNMKTYTTEVYEIMDELAFNLPDDLVEELKWVDGDKILWIDNNDGSFTLRKENE